MSIQQITHGLFLGRYRPHHTRILGLESKQTTPPTLNCLSITPVTRDTFTPLNHSTEKKKSRSSMAQSAAGLNGTYSAIVVDNVLKYTISSEEKGEVDLKDIVCVVPRSDHQRGYTVLSLERSDDEGDKACERLVKIDIQSLPEGLLSFFVESPPHLSREEPVQVVISTRSGTGTAKRVFQNIIEPFFRHLAVEYQVHETQSAQTIIELSRSQILERACAGIAQTVVLLSGDGGLIDIVDAFYRSNRQVRVAPDIAMIPCGTGNAMASSIGFRAGPASGLNGLIRGQPSPISVFAANLSRDSQLVIDEGRQRAPIDGQSNVPFHTIYGAVVASWGLHAALVADSDTAEYRKFGSERFKLAAKELLFPSDGTEPHRFQGKISLSTKKTQAQNLVQETLQETEHMYVLATLVPRLEKDFVISPDSDAFDGCMRLLRFGPMSGEDAMRLMTLAYQGGRHVLEKVVTYTEVERVRIDFQESHERWRRVCIDGQIVAVEKGGWMEIRKEPRRLLNVIKL